MSSLSLPPGLELFHDLVHTLNATLDLDSVLAQVIDRVNEFLCIEATSVSLLDPLSQELVIQMTIGKATDPQRGLRLPPFAGIAGWVAHHGEAVRIDDAQQDERFYPAVDQLTGFTTRSMLCVPLRIQGHSIGVIEAINSRTGVFSHADLCFMVTLADVAALAIENARLYGVEQQAVHLATARQAIADTLGVLSDQEDGLSAALAHLHEIVACDSAAILLVELDHAVASGPGLWQNVGLSGEMCLQPVAMWGQKDPAARSTCRPIQDLPLYRHIWTSGSPLSVIDVQQDDRYVAPWQENVRSWFGAPLVFEGQTLGFVSLGRRRVDEFLYQEVQAVQVLAAQVARVLAHLKAYHASQEHAGRLAILNEILTTAISIRQADVLWEQITARLVALLAVRGAGILLLDETEGIVTRCVQHTLAPDLARMVRCGPVAQDTACYRAIAGQQMLMLPLGASGDPDASGGAGLLLPIGGAGGVVGLLLLQEPHPSLPSAARLALLQAVAAQIGMLADRSAAPPGT